jgi:hypothetical protein
MWLVAGGANAGEVDYLRDIKPLLRERCSAWWNKRGRGIKGDENRIKRFPSPLNHPNDSRPL